MKNAIVWFDLPTLNFNRAVKFYSKILGEKVKVDKFMGGKFGFFPMEKMGDVGGDIVPPNSAHKPSARGTRVYFSCEGKLDSVIGRVEKAGGKVIKPKYSLGKAGWAALIKDTEGNIVGLHSMKK